MIEVRYHLGGDVDLAAAPEVESDLRAIIESTHAHVLVDCTHLTFIDSTGIAALVRTSDALEADGRHMLVANLPRNCRRVFDMLGLSHMYTYERLRIVSAGPPDARRDEDEREAKFGT